MNYFFVLLFVCLSVGFFAGGLIFARLLAPRRLGAIKNDPYECGQPPIGPAWIQFNGDQLIGRGEISRVFSNCITRPAGDRGRAAASG